MYDSKKAKVPTVHQILDMVKEHYLKHPLIPEDRNTKSYETIRNESLLQMVKFCIERDLLDALAYLYKDWYSRKWSQIWMRSVKEDYVCRYRTSMFAESHYRILKRDFFSQFGRPVMFFS